MHSDNYQNLSIQLEEDPTNLDNISMAKCDTQLTQELYEIARKIAESDRNNQAYRLAKKNKATQLDAARKIQIDRQLQYQEILNKIEGKKAQVSQYGVPFQPTKYGYENFAENLRSHQRQIQAKYIRETDDLYEEAHEQEERQKALQENNIGISQENQKISKKIANLQVEYDLLMRNNKQKGGILNNLKKQKQEKENKIRQNQERITQMEVECEKTKNNAQQLENQLREELKIETELDQIIKEREIQLQIRNKAKQETERKKEESKRAVNKMVNTIKTIELEIEDKLKEAERLQSVHESLKQKIIEIDSRQRKLDELMSRRQNVISTLKNFSMKASQSSQGIEEMQLTGDENEFEESYS